ncbi:hypothetical protein ABTP10_19770, partial [Acinetobacter baumannii]
PLLSRIVLYKPFKIDDLDIAVQSTLQPPTETLVTGTSTAGRVVNWPTTTLPRQYLAGHK